VKNRVLMLEAESMSQSDFPLGGTSQAIFIWRTYRRDAQLIHKEAIALKLLRFRVGLEKVLWPWMTTPILNTVLVLRVV
jgi:hypothetical protein